MIINREKYPILKWLKMEQEEFGKNDTICTYECDGHKKWDWATDILFDNWDAICGAVKNNVEIVASTFYKAVLGNFKMFSQNDALEFIKEHKPKGVLLLPRDNSVIYDLDPRRSFILFLSNSDAIDSIFISGVDWRDHLTKYFDGDDLLSHLEVLDRADGALSVGTDCHNKELAKKGFQPGALSVARYSFTITLCILMLKYYAKIETRVLAPKDKIKDAKTKEKYINQENQALNILDCRWFTDIVRNSPFGVRGHFRLQPKKNKDGVWVKELIYIEPFMKKGYVSKAKIRSFDETQQFD